MFLALKELVAITFSTNVDLAFERYDVCVVTIAVNMMQ